MNILEKVLESYNIESNSMSDINMKRVIFFLKDIYSRSNVKADFLLSDDKNNITVFRKEDGFIVNNKIKICIDEDYNSEFYEDKLVFSEELNEKNFFDTIIYFYKKFENIKFSSSGLVFYEIFKTDYGIYLKTEEISVSKNSLIEFGKLLPGIDLVVFVKEMKNMIECLDKNLRIKNEIKELLFRNDTVTGSCNFTYYEKDVIIKANNEKIEKLKKELQNEELN